MGDVILATFYGGPADGGTALLVDPICETLVLPVDHARLAAVPSNKGVLTLPCWQVPAFYHLDLDGRGQPNYLTTPGGSRLVRYRVHATHNKPSNA